MRITGLNIILGLTALSIMAVSCKKDEQQQQASVGFKMRAVDTQSGLKNTGGETGSQELLPITWETAWVVVNKLEFKAEFHDSIVEGEGAGSYEVKLEWKGNKTLDLMTEPEVFAYINLPDGYYDKVELEVESHEVMNDGINFYLAGTITAALGEIPIVIEVSDSFEAEAEMKDWIINTEEQSFYEGLLEISLERLFSGISIIDLENAELTDGTIIISANSNTSLYAIIVENLHGDMECDHDGGDDDDDDD